MHHDVSITPQQLEALHEWAETGGAYPADILLVREGSSLVAGQGDARVRIWPDGTTEDNPRPYTDQEAKPDAFQRWTVTLPDGSGFDATIRNLYDDEQRMGRLVELADCEAYSTTAATAFPEVISNG